MNLCMIRPKNETKDLLLSITKNCETLIKQTHRKTEETLEFKMIQSKQTFLFKPPIPIEGSWMIGLTDLEVYNSIYTITEQNNKLQIYKFPDEKSGGVSYEKVRDEIGKDLDISDITATDLQDDIIGPNIIKENREQVTKRMIDDKFMNNLASYFDSVFQDFENFLRTQIDLIEDDINLVLDEYNSSFVTYELELDIYTFKDISEALFNIVQLENPGPSNAIVIEFDGVTRKTELVVRNGIIAIRFDEKSFFSIILGFTSGWDYKHYIEDISQKIVNLSTTNKMHLKCDVIDHSVVNGLREPILFSFVLDKPSGYKVFSEPETIHYKKLIRSVLNTTTFYLRDDDHKPADFHSETLSFTLQLIKF